MTRRPDEWLIRQRELPGRPKLSERRLYRRRERTFTVLAGVFLVATALMPLLGTSRLFGAARPVRELGLSLGGQLLLPVGVVALPLALVALALACELFGKRRARALVMVATLTWLGLLGLAWVTDRVPEIDGGTTRAFGPHAACTAALLVTCVLQIELFDALGRATRGRHLWLRNVLAIVVALAAGWLGFVLLVSYVPLAALPPLAGFTPAEQLQSIAIASAGYTAVGVVVGTIALYALAGPLATALRIERYIVEIEEIDERDLVPRRSAEPAFTTPHKPKAKRVEGTPEPGRAARSGVSNSRPFTSDEVAFFDRGEELAQKPAADSFSDLERQDR